MGHYIGFQLVTIFFDYFFVNVMLTFCQPVKFISQKIQLAEKKYWREKIFLMHQTGFEPAL